MTDRLIEEATRRHNRGVIYVLTGNGKGKTTAAMGQALRAIGHGRKVLMIQFMKGKKYGEVLAAEKFLPDLVIRQSGLDSFVMRDNPAPVDVELAREGWKLAKEAMASGAYDMIILDELNVALDFKLVPLEDVLGELRNKPAALDVIITGRYAPREIIELAATSKAKYVSRPIAQ